ncbi:MULTISPECIES: YihY/virulence factor BrkB family protein [Nocardiopsis]|uniref:Ribonuclease BN n=1 Tax=Nocardiopsis dassonvillei (strain ATCC 23218 / DSM 43111 / CIP 107115 / JCM 7437 / KCTC 9190 / NBRC 14626 / NCTC 10488 / NRRL B-5397 / IMRU 509) TaxID=446468 RepID=D7B6R7_NOCDD|nr:MULTISPECIES: YhjD/YihY/BrkB family envelope integrity protein [Nocardiopsis]ADH69354.1 ribonuclease BN [Nocardiopsis dassonvillei subsp. dassonvillei DSM 43111]NKY81985.1 ribonuclease BN [Nocardiopsis dassonvillei]VEI89864.1 Inner membrane protein yhjD [Nocardiopsis dassonvillei]
MAAALDRARDTGRHYRNLGMDAYWELRRRRPALDHLVRAYERYADRNGNQLAGAVTYFAFLSFFPLLALAFAAVGYLAAVQVEVGDYLQQALDGVLPGLSEQLPIDEIAQARVGAGVIGVLGLLYAGLNAVSALREALHSIWLKNLREGPNILLRKLADLLVMLGLGAALLLAVAFTSVAQTATQWLLGLVGLDGSLLANLSLRALALVIAVGANIVIFVLAFALLSGSGRPTRMMWRGALLGAVGFEVLKAAAAVLLAGTLGNPVYASFAVLVGLLVWINLVMRLVMFSAAWTATWLPMPPPYTGSLPLPEEHGMDWTRPDWVSGVTARVAAREAAERRRARRALAGVLSLLGAAGAAGTTAWALRRRRGDRV